MFTVGINTHLRISELLRITAGMVRDLEAMDELEIKEKKTDKNRREILSKGCVEAIQ